VAPSSRARRLLLATTNRDKQAEIRALLAGLPVEVLTLGDLPPVPEPEETGVTFEENARLKALHYDEAIDPAHQGLCETVAEDSGLVIDALGGEPGVRSARFVRPDASYPERFAEIYRRLAPVDPSRWTARFVCALAVVRGGQVIYETTGTVEGFVAPAARGSAGFGYDPIFFYPPYGMTLAEASTPMKLAVAHRGIAIRRLVEWLKSGSADAIP
jgi:XTP/dITP diphosphohydrolase